ncbi:unnamed protein product [Porites lobata]|uniref:Uncharacterized protein n=1 Tax=Porites lobata TaxID=104759 RepID=A0ABN8RHQ3_9CNID|nr:unnamed protein product [Porites lobata]
MTSIILERDVHAERNADQHFDTKQVSTTSDTEAATTDQGNSKSADKWIPAIAILTSGLALFLIY